MALNQLINVTVAEKVSALRTESYIAERAARAETQHSSCLRLRPISRARQFGAMAVDDFLPILVIVLRVP